MIVYGQKYHAQKLKQIWWLICWQSSLLNRGDNTLLLATKKRKKKNSIKKPAKIKCIAYYNERQKAQPKNSREYEVARNKQSNKDRSCQSFNKPVTCNSWKQIWNNTKHWKNINFLSIKPIGHVKIHYLPYSILLWIRNLML